MEYEEYIQSRMEKDLILIRGISGSGKSTLAEAITDKENICTADDLFMDKGEYKFDGSKLKDAHAYCQIKCRLRMAVSAPLIIVANTFTKEWEMKAYFDLAQEFKYRVHSVIVENRMSTKNIHFVSDEAIQKMISRFEISL